jgi:uncharacterized membrane protein YraQ (UPF0718 family)
MKKLIVWTMAMVFSLCVSLAFAAEEKKAEPPTTPAKAEEKVIKAEKKEMKAKKKLRRAKRKVRKAKEEKKELENKEETK